MQLKKIVLAALAAASFAPAIAFVKTEVPVAEAELVFMAWNDKGTFTKDLGFSLDSLTSTTQFNFAGAQWDAFQALGGSNTLWSLTSISKLNDPNDAGNWVLTSSFVDTTVQLDVARHVDGLQILELKYNEMEIRAKQLNGGVAVANHNFTTANGTVGDVFGGYTNYGEAIKNEALVSSGATLNMLSIASSGDDWGMPVLVANNNGKTANFMGTTLTIEAVTAVPEPSTYALLLAGLCAVGFVARRRQA